MLKGIAASAGVSVAKVYKLETPNVVIEKKQGDPQAEIKKFDEALERQKRISKVLRSELQNDSAQKNWLYLMHI